MEYLYWILGGMLIGGTSVALIYQYAWLPWRIREAERMIARSRRDFHLRREQLEAKFFTLAGNSGKPRGLRWTDCQFSNDVTYAKDRRTGLISAFVAVEIRFEAIVGGGMEEVEAVSNVRAATAVFNLNERGQWTTDGRAIFNLNPSEAINYYQANLELVGED
jgi:hypothetical protein